MVFWFSGYAIITHLSMASEKDKGIAGKRSEDEGDTRGKDEGDAGEMATPKGELIPMSEIKPEDVVVKCPKYVPSGFVALFLPRPGNILIPSE